MFKWLTNLIVRTKAKDTEARRLKEEIIKNVEECKEKAAQGDSDATLKLQAYTEKLTEQSIRFMGGGK